MKKNWSSLMINIAVKLLFILSTVGCDSIIDSTSALKIYITDSPTNNVNINQINIAISRIEAKKNNQWVSLRYLENPISINMMDYTAGKTFLLVGEVIQTGLYSDLRLTFETMNKNSPLVINPQCHLKFKDGTSKSLFWFNDEPKQATLKLNIEIKERETRNMILDFDVRRSIKYDPTLMEYTLEPSMQILDYTAVGSIEIAVSNPTASLRSYACLYESNQYNDSEANVASGDIPFKKALASSVLSLNDKFLFGYVNPGTYDIIYVEYNETGLETRVLLPRSSTSVVKGKQSKVEVTF